MKILSNMLALLLLTNTCLSAQSILQGKVIDQKDNLPLIGATVQVGSNSTITNIDGQYSIEIATSDTLLICSYVGYQTKTIPLNSTITLLDIQLESSSLIIDEVVVSGSRFKKNLIQEAVSVEILKPDFVEKNVVTRLDEIVAKVPGVQIIDGQTNIRSSGFSFFSGSRVGFIIDELPYLNPTTGSVQWDFIPIENLGQLEITKGASSVLYGTSAMNGLINFKTAQPTSTPYTSLSVYGGLFAAPENEYQKWWTDENRPYRVGGHFSHRKKYGDKFDLVVGAHYHDEQSYLEGTGVERGRVNVNTRYKVSDNLYIGVNGNYQEHEIRSFFIWQDADTNALRPLGSISPDRYRNYSIDPYLKYIDDKGNTHNLRTRFYIYNFLREGNDNTNAIVGHAEYQFQRRFNNGLSLTTGISTQQFDVESVGFPVDTITNNVGIRLGGITGIYAQVEKKFLNNKLNVSLGTRYEFYNFGEDVNSGVPVFTANATYEVTPKDYIRANFGQGYRIPSLIERYTDRILAGVRIHPNPEILPEQGWSAEIGYKKGFDAGSANGYFDAAIFWMEYENLIEYQFGFYGDTTDLLQFLDFNNFGFRSNNITRARIAGIELSTQLEGKLGDLNYRLWAGYTYTYPGDLVADTSLVSVGNFLDNFVKGFNVQDTSVHQGILRYRTLNTARLDLELNYKAFTIGVNAAYNGWMVNIDGDLVGEGFWGEFLALQAQNILGRDELFPGMANYRANNQTGNWVFDLRLRYDISPKHNINLIVNNVFNTFTVTRIGRVDPTRLVSLKYGMRF